MDNILNIKKKNEKLSFTNDENRLTHELIIGDNYDALLNLMVNLKNKIDVIYIDPPYGKNDMGEFANTNYVNFITRDNLLSMLYPRLLLAKKLLNDEGIIICSIDDKNQAYVKGIMDEIFNENNFVACCPRKSAGSRTTKSMNQLQVLHDYILIYRAPNNKALLQNVVGEKNIHSMIKGVNTMLYHCKTTVRMVHKNKDQIYIILFIKKQMVHLL